MLKVSYIILLISLAFEDTQFVDLIDIVICTRAMWWLKEKKEEDCVEENLVYKPAMKWTGILK